MKNRYLVFGLSVFLALALAVPAMGGPSNPVASVSASVKSIATKALKKAKAAQKTAKAAQNAANAAQSTANAANTAAGKAQTAADKAQTTANSALTEATTANAAAKKAQEAADAAQATANSKFGSTNFEEGAPVSGSGGSALAASGCPSGEVPSGGGFVVNGSDSNKVRVDLSSQYLNGWIVSADNISGLAGGNWELTAVAICIT
ncbi:MAG TPA: hypothetical protein VFT79_13995 [Solirubrobacterales bacterium]|nr:hypothetical protein [Solirubrobacterales bacterium]